MIQPAPGRTVYDATFGRGGHTRAFLEKGARVVALDVDPAAEVEATLEQRPAHLDVILTGPSMPASLLAMADQVTQLRRNC